MVEKYAYPLTFLFAYDEEAKAWASLACEISVASCGDSVDDAREMLKDAIGLWASYEIEEGKGPDLAHPAEPDYLAEYFSGEGVVTEYHTFLVVVESEPKRKVVSLEFIRSSVAPLCRHQQAAA